MASFPSIPSQSEAAALGALATPQLSKLGDIRAELDEIFSVCRPAWIADFLFNPIMDSVPSLTAPHNMSGAISCSIAMTSIQCTPCTDRIFDRQITAGFLIVPAYSIGHIFVGFGVEDCRVTNYSTWCTGMLPPRNKPSHVRFVLDVKKGIFCTATLDEDESIYYIDYIASDSLASRRRVFAVFDADALRRAAYSDCGVLSVDELLPALQIHKSIVERRPCPACGLSRNSPCVCKFEMTLPAHPLDFSSLANNMMSFAGPYEGLEDSNMLVGGVKVISAKVGSRIVIEGVIGPDLISRLSRWAITDQLKDKMPDPREAITLGIGSEPKELGEGDERKDGSEVVDVDSSAGTAWDTTQLIGFAENLGDITLPGTSGSSSEPCYLVAKTLGDAGDNCNSSMVVDPNFEEILSQPDGYECEVFDSAGEIPGAVGIENQIANDTTNASDSPMGSIQMNALQSTNESRISRRGQHPDKGKIVQQRPQMVSSMVQIVSNTNAKFSSYRGIGEKEKRLELRKQRNREAAQRSNSRRKLQNDALKTALQELQERISELRVRELALREENLELRRMTSSWRPISSYQ